MKARPILFSDPMIQALLRGRKTMTRRVVKPQPSWPSGQEPDQIARIQGGFVDGYGVGHECAYGQPGDLLWVRETWAPAFCSISYEYGEACYFKWDSEMYGPLSQDAHGLSLHYRADGEDVNPAEFSMPHGNEIGWKPSIHMPRWASRLTLRLTDVRVERVQDISEEDSAAEGVRTSFLPLAGPNGTTVWHVEEYPTPKCSTEGARDCFAGTWNYINSPKGYGWEANPWVWCLSFSVIHQNIDEVIRSEQA